MVAVLVYTDNKIATAHCKQSETLRLHYNLVSSSDPHREKGITQQL